jgi:serine/threonine protein kinase
LSILSKSGFLWAWCIIASLFLFPPTFSQADETSLSSLVLAPSAEIGTCFEFYFKVAESSSHEISESEREFSLDDLDFRKFLDDIGVQNAEVTSKKREKLKAILKQQHIERENRIREQTDAAQFVLGPLGEPLGYGGFSAVFALDANRAVKLGMTADVANRELHMTTVLWRAWERDVRSKDPTALNPFFDMRAVEIKEGTPVLVMQRRGPSLETQLASYGCSKANFEKTKRVANRIISIVRFVHHNGIVPQDLKPANTYVDEHENVALGDFGVGADLRSENPLYRLKRLGTLDYHDPNQNLSGEAENRDDMRGGLRELLTELFLGERKTNPRFRRYVQEYEVFTRRFWRWIRSPHTIDPRIPEEISAALWHRSNSDEEFAKIWAAAFRYMGKPEKFWPWYEKNVLGPLSQSSPEEALAEVNGSAEIQSAILQGYIRFSVPIGTRSRFSTQVEDEIPPIVRGSQEWIQYKLDLIAVANGTYMPRTNVQAQAPSPASGLRAAPASQELRPGGPPRDSELTAPQF